MTALQVGFWVFVAVVVGVPAAAWVMKRKADAVLRRRERERAGD